MVEEHLTPEVLKDLLENSFEGMACSLTILELYNKSINSFTFTI